MSSKITNAMVLEAVQEMRAASKERKFVETVELQIALKDYDPSKDKRFVGSVRLPNCPRPTLKICLIADAKHQEEAKKTGVDIDITDLDTLKKFNKDKKLIKKWAKKYTLLLASDTVLKKVPVVVGPILNKIQRFPTVVSHVEPLAQKVADVRSSVKFQLKKVTCMATAVGRIDMSDEELKQNIMMSLNFLASLLKKGWHNLKKVVIKTTMGKPITLYAL
jgi:large subunit ribosomal protein L10Ae